MLEDLEKLTEKYKNRVVEGVSYDMNISLGLLDYDATNNAALSFEKSNPAVCCNCKTLVNTSKATTGQKYFSFEKDAFILGSNTLKFYSNNDELDRYISRVVCDAESKFTTGPEPLLIIGFPDGITCSTYGLTLYFDEVDNIYPTSITVTTYKNGEIHGVRRFDGINDVVYEMLDDPSNAIFDDFNILEIRINSLNRPYTRARVSGINLGIIKDFSSNDMVDTFTHSIDIDPTTRRLPQQKMSFTVRTGDLFDPENPNGITGYLEEYQPVTATLNISYNDGTPPESVKICDMLLAGDYSTDDSKTTFTVGSYLQNANEKYEFVVPQNSLEPYTLKKLLDNGTDSILYKMNLPKTTDGNNRWEIDDILERYFVPEGFEIKDLSLKECIQLIALAGCCVVYEDSNGVIQIKRPTEEQGVSYVYDRMYSVPVLNRCPQLGDVKVYWYSGNTKSIDGTNPINAYESSLVGEIEEIDDIFIQTPEQAKEVANFVASHLSKRDEYTVEVQGGLETEILDQSYIETKYANKPETSAESKRTCTVIQKNMTYNGAINTELVFSMDN